MSVDLNYVTKAINNWLARNDLPRDGVTVRIEFPDKASALRAEAVIRREVDEVMKYHIPGAGTFGKIETMNGIGLTLSHRQHG